MDDDPSGRTSLGTSTLAPTMTTRPLRKAATLLWAGAEAVGAANRQES